METIKQRKHILASFCFGNNYMAVVPKYEDYIVDIFGNVYKISGCKKLSQFNSNKYRQVLLRDRLKHKRSIKGVHQVVAMSFLDNYFDGSVIHHIDENPKNNNVLNLECMTKSDHCKHHARSENFTNYIKEHGVWNKGRTMSDEFRQHCRESALKRHRQKRN